MERDWFGREDFCGEVYEQDAETIVFGFITVVYGQQHNQQQNEEAEDEKKKKKK